MRGGAGRGGEEDEVEDEEDAHQEGGAGSYHNLHFPAPRAHKHRSHFLL